MRLRQLVMKSAPLLLALRAAALIAAAGFAAENVRGYLTSRWGLSVSPRLYGVLALTFIWVVFWLSTRNLLRKLRADANVPRPPIAGHQPKASEGRDATVHRYPLQLTYLVGALGFFLIALPYLSVEPGKTVALVTYAACFGIACIVFAIDYYIFTYSVTVEHDAIVVQAFGKRSISFSDVANIEVVKTKNGQQIVVALKDGHIIRFGRMLTDFSLMLDALTSRTAHRTN